MKLSAIIRKEILQLIFVVLSFILMVVASYYFVSNIVERLTRAYTNQILNTAEATIRSDLREAELTLLHAALMVERILVQEGPWDSPVDEIKDYLNIVDETLERGKGWAPGLLNIYV